MSAQYEILPPGGHETYAEKIFRKIKSYVESKVQTNVPNNAVFTDTLTTAYCNTAASTITKIAQCTNFSLTNNSYITINFVNGNTVTADSGVTLNINNTGAKPLYVDWDYEGARAYDQPFNAGIYILYYTNNAYYLYTDGQIYRYREVAYQNNLKYYSFTSSDLSVDINESIGALIGHPTYYTEDLSVKKVNGHTVNTDVPSDAIFTDTKNTAGSTDTSSKIFLIGATSQAANPQTYSQDTAYVGTDGCLYSGGSKVLTAHQDISGKADMDDLAREYSSDTVQLYHIGDLVYYDGDLYRCINGTSGGNWMPSFWQHTRVATELENKIEGLSVAGASGGSYQSEITTSIWFDPDQFNYLTGSHKVELNSNFDPSNKVSKTGDTMSGALTFTKNDGADIVIPARTISYIAGNQGNAGIYAKKDLNAQQWYPILCMDTKSGGSWAIGNYNDENLQFSYATKANRDSSTNTTSLVIMRNIAGTLALTSELTWNTISGKPSTFTPSSHNHGLLHDNFTVTLANTKTDSGWSMINSTYNGFLLKSIRFNGSSPGWGVGNYGAGICFGGGDTKGILSCAYGSPSIKIAGGNGTKPVWWIGISGTSGASYNLANLMPLSGDSTKLGHLQLGDVNGSYILRTALIARKDTGDSGYVNFVTYTNKAYAPIRASAFTTMSCKHTKTNVVDISEEDALKLLDIRPVNFDYVEEVGGQKDQIGVLAEDTYEVLPKVVSVPDDYVEEDFDISKGIHQPLPSVDYAKFVPYLIKLVQMQQKEINELRADVQSIIERSL